MVLPLAYNQKQKPKPVNMSEENNTAVSSLDDILQNEFVQSLLRLVSEIRTAVGDAEGKLENSEVVDRVREAMKK